MHDISSFPAYLDGRWICNRELCVPFNDIGFVLGATATEQLRTFRGKLFRLEEHLERLFHSLEIMAVEPGYSAGELRSIALEVVARCESLVNFEPPAGSDIGVGIFVTPGAFPTLSGTQPPQPLVAVYAFPLPFHLWARKFAQGESVVISDVRQIPAACWPPELKCRSRMHYYLADLAARKKEPASRAILLDAEGKISEATTANLVMYRAGEGLVSPPIEKILPGISLTVLKELAGEQGIPFTHRDIPPSELLGADEVFLTSTSVCILPVVRCDGRPIGTGKPGETFRRLLNAWSRHVEVDIPRQAEIRSERR